MCPGETAEVDYVLTVNSEQAASDLRRIETILMRVLSYIKRMSGGNENIEAFVNQLQRVIIVIRAVQIALRALEMASGPIGWAYAAVAAVGVALTVNDALYDSTRGMG